MYTLYSDKQNIFECDIQLEGASLTDAFARLIIESDNINLMYNGTITSDGNCRISMPKLKNKKYPYSRKGYKAYMKALKKNKEGK